MKRFLHLLSAVCLCAVTAVCFAAGASAALCGDVQEPKGSIDAADARYILRTAVSLETLSGEQFEIADMDNDGKISAADARTTLRTAVTLEPIRHYYRTEVVTPPTCTAPGTGKLVCTECDDVKDTVLPATGHSFGDTPKIITPATCTAPGQAEYTCTVCGAAELREIPAAHKWVITCTAPKRCSVCGVSEGEAPGHTTKIGYCERCGEYIAELEAEAAALTQKIKTAIAAQQQAYETLNYGIDTGNPAYLISYGEKARAEYGTAYNYFIDAYYQCADYAEFSAAKSLITKCYNEILKIRAEDSINAANFNEVISVIDVCADRLSAYSDQLISETKGWQK